MLVLSRKPGEKVHVGRDITFTVLTVQANRVRIGIDAPVQVPVFRDELRDQSAEPFVGKEGPSPETCHAGANS
jgi:carbon storage regulator